MKVSLNVVKQFVNVDLGVNELVQVINQKLGQVESVADLGPKYKDAVIVKVVSCTDHPDSDHMHVCRIDDGGVVPGVERSEDGTVQVVCGASNVRAGMVAVWLPPGSTVPSSYDEQEPFVLGSRALRGVVSHGMLASPRELALGDDHEGILDIDPVEWKPTGLEIKPGVTFADAFGLDDIIIDLENKMFTHRPDCFGQIGVAREIFAILQPLPSADSVSEVRFPEPEWYWQAPQFQAATGLALKVFNDVPEKVPRFMAVTLKDVEVQPSPLWLRVELVRLGSKPINNIVDATNYIMLMTAQPTHAYDFDKLRGGTIGTRLAKKGEKAELLNGRTYQLDESDIVIVDGEGVVGLGGIMGGGNSEVSPETKNVVLEVASFDMYAIRKTSMRHGLFTDAVTRFNKGQSPLQTNRVLARLIEMTGGKQASQVFDLPESLSGLEKVSLSGPLRISTAFINERLGTGLTDFQVGNIMRLVNFASYSPEDDTTVLEMTAPFWRSDIHVAEDIVEEVGRLYGFDKMPRELPKRHILPAAKNTKIEMKRKIRHSLSVSGANEVKTYSFVHENLLNKTGQDIDQAFRLGNALSPDLQYYRLSVLPSLLDKVHANIKAGHDEFTLFEIGKAHNKKYHADDDNGLPLEMEMVDLVYTSKKPREGAAFYHVRRLMDELGRSLKIDLRFLVINEPIDYPLTAPFELSRSAYVEAWKDGKKVSFVGIIGELRSSVIKSLKLPEYTAVASLDLDGIISAVAQSGNRYQAISRFPSTSQDISLRVAENVTYANLTQNLTSTLESVIPLETVTVIEPLGTYQPESSSLKTVTYRIAFTNYQRTLIDSEVSGYLDKISENAAKSYSAERI